MHEHNLILYAISQINTHSLTLTRQILWTLPVLYLICSNSSLNLGVKKLSKFSRCQQTDRLKDRPTNKYTPRSFDLGAKVDVSENKQLKSSFLHKVM